MTGTDSFMQAVRSRDARIGVVGLGYVGLPLAFSFVDAGFTVLGVDIDQAKVDTLAQGKTYIKHLPDTMVARARGTGRFQVTTDFSCLAGMDAILLCVPTPLTTHREPDMSFVVSTAEAIGPCLKAGQLVVLESTTYPGTSDELLAPLLERSSGLASGVDFFVAYSPEREDPGNRTYSTTKIPKVVGGCGEEALNRAACLYEQIVPRVVPVSTARTAEAVKLTENIFRCVNIALVNELKMVYAEMGIDIWEVIDAAKTKPFGFMPFYPGPGLGGHCIPIDPFYLTWKAREYGCATRFIELAGEVNVGMPDYVIRRLMHALNDRKKALNGSRVLVLGLSYKKDVDDIRESPSLVLLEELMARGAEVDYHDPFVPRIKVTRKHGRLAGMESVELTATGLAGYDAVLIATDHGNVDYTFVVQHATLVVDTRNATKGVTVNRERVVQA